MLAATAPPRPSLFRAAGKDRGKGDGRLGLGLRRRVGRCSSLGGLGELRAVRMLLQPVVELGDAVAQDFVQVGRDRIRRKLQPRLGFGSIALDRRSGASRQLQHGGVLAQRMNEHGLDVAVAGVQHGVLEQASPKAAPPSFRQDRNAEFRRCGPPAQRIAVAMRQMGERDQFEAAIENAEYLVEFEIEGVDIAANLGVAGGVAEAAGGEPSEAVVSAALKSGESLMGEP
jgi:hypothetical protein